MNPSAFKWCITALLTVLALPALAQDTRAFNQNASRSNHTRLAFSMSPVVSNPVGNSNDSLLFRGTGGGFTFGADYYMGRAALGFTAGFISSEADESAINNFIARRSIVTDQVMITKSRQQSIYLLLGPSIQFGNTITLEGHIKG